MYKHLVGLLLKAVRCEVYNTGYDIVVQFYADLNLKFLLATQFKQSGNSTPTLQDIKDYLVSPSPAARFVMSEVCPVLKLVTVMLATNAVSKRSASALRRVHHP